MKQREPSLKKSLFLSSIVIFEDDLLINKYLINFKLHHFHYFSETGKRLTFTCELFLTLGLFFPAFPLILRTLVMKGDRCQSNLVLFFDSENL